MSKDDNATALGRMLGEDSEARAFFSSLPGYVQDMIRQRADNIHTPDELARYADNITAGDK